MNFDKQKHYRPLMIFMLSLLVFAVILAVFVIFDYARAVRIREDCRTLCEANDMVYEGVKDSICACLSSINTRVYLDLSV